MNTLINPRTLLAFHGPSTTVSPWTSGTRQVSFSVDSGDSPIPLPSSIRTAVTQSFDGQVVRNTMRLQGYSSLLAIESMWSCDETELMGTAKITVRVPRPLGWLAEHFVARKAQVQMDAFAEFVSRHPGEHGVEGR